MALEIGVTTGVSRAGGVALATMRGEMPTAHRTCLENCRFPHVASLNEDDGWFRRSLKPSIVSRLRGCHSLSKGSRQWNRSTSMRRSVSPRLPPARPSLSASSRLKVMTGAAEVFGEGCLLRLSAVLIQTGAMLVGIGVLASVVRRTFPGGRLAIDRSKRTNIPVPRRF